MLRCKTIVATNRAPVCTLIDRQKTKTKFRDMRRRCSQLYIVPHRTAYCRRLHVLQIARIRCGRRCRRGTINRTTRHRCAEHRNRCTADGRGRRPQWRSPLRSPLVRTAVLAQQHLLECLAEHLIEDGVEDRIHHRTGVAQPRDHIEHPCAHLLLAALAQRRQQVEHEERRP